MSERPWRRVSVASAAVATLVLALTGTVSPASAANDAPSCTSMTAGEIRSLILSEVNAERSRAGEKALGANPALQNVAAKWSDSQADAEKMSHNPRYAQQIPEGWFAAGENVAYGYSPTAVTQAWMDSPGHRANILRSSFTDIGIGVSCSDKGRAYYTQVFAGYPSLKAATPAIAGTPKAGAKLTAKTGAWTSGTTLRYQWLVGGKKVSGATAKSYVPKSADAGKTVKVKVTGSKAGYRTTAKTSKATKAIKKPAALPAKKPVVRGTLSVGEKLTAVRGTWASKVTYSYRWYRDGATISKATKKTYTLTSRDRGAQISVKVTGKKSGFTTTSRTSARTAEVR